MVLQRHWQSGPRLPRLPATARAHGGVAEAEWSPYLPAEPVCVSQLLRPPVGPLNEWPSGGSLQYLTGFNPRKASSLNHHNHDLHVSRTALIFLFVAPPFPSQQLADAPQIPEWSEPDRWIPIAAPTVDLRQE